MNKPEVSTRTMRDMAIINFATAIAFSLQQGNLARIFQSLGADLDALPILMIAGPITGLIVQPLIGHFSDQTWMKFAGRMGRRHPYFLCGALLTAAALVGLSYATSLVMAVICYWILDASLNVVIEPARALVGDVVGENQRAQGLAMMASFGCIGAILGFLLPFGLAQFYQAGAALQAGVPMGVHISLLLSAAILLMGVGWTVWRVHEYPPEHDAKAVKQTRIQDAFSSIWADFCAMPSAMVKLAVIQFFTWFALYIMWPFMTAVVTQYSFNAQSPDSVAYNQGADWLGILYAWFNVVAALFGLFILPQISRKLGMGRAHALCLTIGFIGFLLILMVRGKWVLLLPFSALGVAWSSLLTLPFVMLTNALGGRKLGIYSGLFNIFVVLPQIAVAVIMGPVLRIWFPHEPIWTMLIAALSMGFAAVLTLVLRPEA